MIIIILINNGTPYTYETTWGISSVGRAFEWHSKGRGFESLILHITIKGLTVS
jgi:hypothetical protein